MALSRCVARAPKASTLLARSAAPRGQQRWLAAVQASGVLPHPRQCGVGPRAPAVQVQKRSLRTSPFPLAAETFKLGEIGEGITKVEITEVFVKEGDMIKEGDNVVAVESDKASVEITSSLSGKIVKLHVKQQDSLEIGAPIMDVDAGGAAAVAAPAAAAPAAAAPAAAAPAAAASSGTQTYKLGEIGEGILEVEITEWFVKEGDVVKEGDNLAAVESDKASVELTSPYSGTVAKLHHQAQQRVKIGASLVDIATAGGAPAAAAPVAAAAPAAAAPAAAAAGPAVQAFKLAEIGEGIAQVQITDMFIKEGDMVAEGDNMFAVESDKASVELTSTFSGKVKKLHYSTGDTVKIGEVLCEIETAGAAPAAAAAAPAPAAAAPVAAAAAPVAAAKPAAAGVANRAPGVLATPKVRGLAREKGIDLALLAGSGIGSRVLVEDVLAAAAAPAAAAVAAPAAAPAAAAAAAQAAPSFANVPRSLEDNVVEITDKVGKGMIKSMTAAMEQPYMALGEEIDVTDIFALQKALKEPALKRYGVKVTLTSFIMKAISLALNEFPIVNSKFGKKDANPPYYTQYGAHNITCAIDSPSGLVVPNIKDCGNLSVIEIQQELNRLVVDAKAGKLSIKDQMGGTITFSNVGSIGTSDPRPILFDGQAVIGAAGRLMTKPRYNAKMEIVPRQIMKIRWVGDHRHLDGATLARFSNSFRRYMEDPSEWILPMR